jgi:hypothetical protein
MKSGLRVFLILLAIVVPVEGHAAVPKIKLEYSPTLDSICALVIGSRINQVWERDLAARKPELEALWERIGPALLSSAEGITGEAFPAGEQTVRLTLCELPSQSFVGVSVNMRYALSSFTQESVPLRYKADTIFHELLHTLLAKHQLKNSQLLKAYANEPKRTREHLHLFALQKAVLLNTNAVMELADVVRIDSQLPGGFYKRAWEIINATDTEYLKYVAEITKK